MTRLTRCLIVAVALVGLGSCSDNSGPVAGILIVSLATPNPSGDGAVLFTVTGPAALTSVTATTGLRVFAQPLSTATRFAVTGALTSGAIVTIGVADVGKAAQYRAIVEAVAAPNFQLRSPAGYSLTVSK